VPPSPLARCHDRQTVSTGGTALRRAVRYAASHRGRTLARLIDLLAFPTVSASARHRRDLESCAAWLARLLREIGLLDVRVAAGRVAPVVTGRWYGLPCAPTVLVYGHYDVQPVGPVSAWANDPFRAVRSGRYLYARGARAS
jgi:acetylornithine deacetylase/succinyl-diaminopimelate desuccinylase-like protein